MSKETTIFCCSEPIAVFQDCAVVRLISQDFPFWPTPELARITWGANYRVHDLKGQTVLQFVRLPNSDTFEAILEFAK